MRLLFTDGASWSNMTSPAPPKVPAMPVQAPPLASLPFHAAATFSAAGDVDGEDAGEELCPADAPGSRRGFGGVAGEGEVQRDDRRLKMVEVDRLDEVGPKPGRRRPVPLPLLTRRSGLVDETVARVEHELDVPRAVERD
jgi:hypothetical protein